jgi:hypothetical protein
MFLKMQANSISIEMAAGGNEEVRVIGIAPSG